MATVEEPRGIKRRIVFELTASLVARFWRGVQKLGPDECWNWQAAPRNGYGALKYGVHVLGTHIVSYRIHKGEVPEGLLVKHSCDNRLCCNPAHLTAGTVAQNNEEMQQRRRLSALRGLEIYNSVLNPQMVRLFDALNMVHGWGAVKQSGLFPSISPNTIKNALYRKNWAHVPKPLMDEAVAMVAEFESRNS